MSRLTATIALACAVLFASSIADAEPQRQKQARQNHTAAVQCVYDNSGHVACPSGVERIQRHASRNTPHSDGSIVSHPAGCPRRAFCGCGVSVKVFGKPVRDLFLAANWLRKFPRTSPSSGMVAARHGHVMYIMSYNGDGTALVYDPNSGGHKTRVHVRSLAGYRVVDPRGGRMAGL